LVFKYRLDEDMMTFPFLIKLQGYFLIPMA